MEASKGIGLEHFMWTQEVCDAVIGHFTPCGFE